jgi:hypothetical protein
MEWRVVNVKGEGRGGEEGEVRHIPEIEQQGKSHV